VTCRLYSTSWLSSSLELSWFYVSRPGPSEPACIRFYYTHVQVDKRTSLRQCSHGSSPPRHLKMALQSKASCTVRAPFTSARNVRSVRVVCAAQKPEKQPEFTKR
jgi:hypothetical protein